MESEWKLCHCRFPELVFTVLHLALTRVVAKICEVGARLVSVIPQKCRTRGSVVVEALSYKPEDRGFQTRLGEWFLSIYLILPATLDPRVYSSFTRNEYHRQMKMFLECKARPVREANNLTNICEPIV
jgi:hypothetical protein